MVLVGPPPKPQDFQRSLMRRLLAAATSRLIHLPSMKNSFFGVAVRAIAGFSRIGILLLVARHFGPALFGRVALAMSMMEIFRTFSEFGLDTVALRHFSQAGSEEECSHIFGRVLTTKLALASVFYICCLVAILAVSHSTLEIQFGAIASISLFSANLVGALVAYYQSQLRMHEIFWVTLYVYVAYVAISIAALWANAPLQWILVVLPAAEFAYFYVLRSRDQITNRLIIDAQGSMALLKESVPLGIMSGMILLYFRLDNVILYKLSGTAALGLYAVCFRMIEPVMMVPGAFAVSLLAVLSAKGQKRIERSELWKMSARTLWPAFLFSLCAAVGLILCGKFLLARFSPEYVAAYPALCILASCLLIRTANIALSAIINSRGAYSSLAKIAAFNLGANIVLVLALVPSMGIVGAAWAALGTEFLNMLAQMRCVGTLTARRVQGPVYEMVSFEPECE